MTNDKGPMTNKKKPPRGNVLGGTFLGAVWLKFPIVSQLRFYRWAVPPTLPG
jgi:hypothetical protein